MRRHIVALSGGKDSTALALRLAEVEPRDYEYVITPTGDELPEMVGHWLMLGRVLGKSLKPIGTRSLNGLIQIQKALPSFRQRWCTRMIKIEPYKEFLYTIAPAVSYVGLRADEEEREGIYGAIEGVEYRHPLREWGWRKSDVYAYLESRGVSVPARTDCARCFYQTLIEWWNLWKDHADIYTEAEAQEEMTGHTFRSPSRDTWPASLKELRQRFERGDRPTSKRKGQTAGQLGIFAERGEMCRVCTL